MTPLIKPLGVLGGTLLLLLVGRKKEEAAPPEPIPPAPKPPIPGPVTPPPAPIPPGIETGFPPGAILGVITNDGVRLRAAPNETSATLGTMARGTLVQIFDDGHTPATPAAPQGWEHARTVDGKDGFVAAQFLTAQGLPGTPRETPLPETGPAPGPAPLPGQPEVIPPAPETQGTETTEEGPLNIPVTILTPEERAALGQLGDLFQGAPPRRAGNAFFSPRIGARAPAYGQTPFVMPRQARFSGLPSTHYRMARALRVARTMTAAQVLAASRAAAARGDAAVAHALQALYLRKLQASSAARAAFAAMRG